MLEQQVLEISA